MKIKLYMFLWLTFFTFIIFGIWEFAQTPFFEDYTDSFNIFVYNRFHCTTGDVLILLSAVLITSLIYRSDKWLLEPEIRHYITVSAVGAGYTIFSEINNVYILKSWGYSELMPTIFGVGLLPLIQWIVLPSIVMFINKNYIKGHYRDML